MTLQSIPIRISPANIKASCSACTLHELCLPMGLSLDDTEQLDKIISGRRKLLRGDYLYRAGDGFRSLYAIRNGFFKIFELDEDGCEKITGFYMAGELLGMDAISDDLDRTALTVKFSPVADGLQASFPIVVAV